MLLIKYFPLERYHHITSFSISSNMNLRLILLASLFHLSSGVTVELRGHLADVACTGEEYADFSYCTTLGEAGDVSAPLMALLQGQAFVNSRGKRQMNCEGCEGGAPRGTYCFKTCSGRSHLKEDTDTPRRLDNVAVFKDGAFDGNAGAIQIAEAIMECFLEDASNYHPCLGNTDTMTLIVTL
jgi:hypothetical protein